MSPWTYPVIHRGPRNYEIRLPNSINDVLVLFVVTFRTAFEREVWENYQLNREKLRLLKRTCSDRTFITPFHGRKFADQLK